ncbi:hypothetical protein [uncultured Thiodictyon sp.]|uniref:hypothetical protein n=1 Tax=uncultured Thiodictyon sp. TaxID=1846217 RepID=UPI0025CFD4DF|nr:hypothetical protein [uncultured Thiodictyon sp.]
MSSLWQDLGHVVQEHWSRQRLRVAQRRLREDTIRLAIERAVDQANPRIRGLNGYRNRLHDTVAGCLDYCEELAWRIPGPVTVSPKTWSSDPLLRALFSDPSRIRWELASSDCRDYMERTALKTSDCYAILLAQPAFRKQLGMDLSGETLQRDIAQTTLSFENIEVVLCAGSPEAVRTRTAQAIMDALVGFAAQEIGRQEARISELEDGLRIMRIKQKVLSPATHGLEILRDGGSAHTTEYLITGRQVHELERELAEAHQGLTTLNDYLERLAALLEHPTALIAARPERVRLDRLNIVRPDRKGASDTTEIEFMRAYRGERAGRMVLMVRFARADLITDQERERQAERYVNA